MWLFFSLYGLGVIELERRAKYEEEAPQHSLHACHVTPPSRSDAGYHPTIIMLLPVIHKLVRLLQFMKSTGRSLLSAFRQPSRSLKYFVWRIIRDILRVLPQGDLSDKTTTKQNSDFPNPAVVFNHLDLPGSTSPMGMIARFRALEY